MPKNYESTIESWVGMFMDEIILYEINVWNWNYLVKWWGYEKLYIL